MQYRGYELQTVEDGITIQNISDFDLAQTFECGQCFRWQRQPDGSYTGVVRGRVANAAMISGQLALRNVTLEDFEGIWFDYFDLGRDYAAVKRDLSADPIMESAAAFGSGIRLLRQEPWETLISFILSSNNRIPRIMKIIEEISRLFGKEIEFAGNRHYSFPGIQSLAACSLDDIQLCRAGYRCDYIHKTAASLAAGEFSLERLHEMNTKDARDELLRLHGVGRKVADCVLLYRGMKHDVFPTDVWVRRVMEELYFGREASMDEIQQFAALKFGPYAGIAQQYLFYYAREHKIGTSS